MERMGAINQYSPHHAPGRQIWTINLSNGITPFMTFFGVMEYMSNYYRLTSPIALSITHVWYRPDREEFDRLSKEAQDHVLNGGLIKGILGLARPLADDPVQLNWDYEQFQEWALAYYGRRLSPLSR
ncbi:MAG: hypothetical protein AB7V46_12425 [Thermomicrobiales bacterium]